MRTVKKAVMTFHGKFKQYDLGEGHPFRGDRFESAVKFFESQGLFKLSGMRVVEPKPASRDDLLRVHSKEYVELIFRLAKDSKPYDVETPVSPEILEAALLIVGGALECGRRVLDGEAERAFSIGGGYHHAGRNYGGGFCLFNDIAILVEYLRDKYDVKRFLIVDYDVHFGNGTSDIYYRDPNVLFVSLHQDPRTIYPRTGFIWQIGDGDGEGSNVNVPLPPGTGDATYLYAFQEILTPLSREFAPEIIIANGGSDAHFADSLGDLNLTANGFFEVGRLLSDAAETVCGGKLILMLGSGYNPKVLPLCWYSLVAGALGLKEVDVKESAEPPAEPAQCRIMVENTLRELKRLLGKRWRCFSGFSPSSVP